MTDQDHLVAEIIDAAGGSITGRVRLQKLFYLLDEMGLESGFTYEYHHYGPYSADLSEAVVDATAFRLINEMTNRRANDGVSYSIYTTGEHYRRDDGDPIGRLGRKDIALALDKLQSYSSTVLEIAATIRWLKHHGSPDWESDLRRLKGVKTEAGRTEQAQRLLRDLGLE